MRKLPLHQYSSPKHCWLHSSDFYHHLKNCSWLSIYSCKIFISPKHGVNFMPSWNVSWANNLGLIINKMWREKLGHFKCPKDISRQLSDDFFVKLFISYLLSFCFKHANNPESFTLLQLISDDCPLKKNKSGSIMEKKKPKWPSKKKLQ